LVCLGIGYRYIRQDNIVWPKKILVVVATKCKANYTSKAPFETYDRKNDRNREIVGIEVPCFSNFIGIVTIGKYMRRPLDG